jgi:hypothetical protein
LAPDGLRPVLGGHRSDGNPQFGRAAVAAATRDMHQKRLFSMHLHHDMHRKEWFSIHIERYIHRKGAISMHMVEGQHD